MTPALAWTLILLIAAVIAAVGAARWVLRRVRGHHPNTTAAGWLRRGVGAVRDRVRTARPVNLETWSETLVARAMRATRPVPGGRALARGYQVRCGASLYAVALPHLDTLAGQFVQLLARCTADATVQPRIRFVYDESLHPEAYELDMDTAAESPWGLSPGTAVYAEPHRALPGGASDSPDPAEEVGPSPWFLRLGDGRRFGVPRAGAVVIGTDPGCDIVVADGYVSGRHAQVTVEDGRLVVRDGVIADRNSGAAARPSMNGTFLRDHPVSTATLDPADAGAALRLGPHVRVEVGYDDPEVITRPMRESGRTDGAPLVSVRPLAGRDQR